MSYIRNLTTRDLTLAALIAAMYTALCLALAPLSFGMMQVRVAEALTLLCVYSPTAVMGVTVGCALSNLVGMATGANILGAVDVVVGTAATLAAGLLSYRLRNVRLWGLPVLSALPPVIINAVVIGAELGIVSTNGFQPKVFLLSAAFNGLFVALGQAVSCIGLGLALVALLDKTAGRYLVPAKK